MVQLGAGDGDAGRRMERVKPIAEVEADFRSRGVFLLVDPFTRKLRFYGYKKDCAEINRMMDSMKGRSKEMGRFLTARAQRVEGETT